MKKSSTFISKLTYLKKEEKNSKKKIFFVFPSNEIYINKISRKSLFFPSDYLQIKLSSNEVLFYLQENKEIFLFKQTKENLLTYLSEIIFLLVVQTFPREKKKLSPNYPQKNKEEKKYERKLT